MQIDYLGLKNFKCFKNLELPMSKITLLTGANSSGKSSVMYAILGALQSGEFPFTFSPNGDFVNLGDFKEISFQNKMQDFKIELNGFFEHDFDEILGQGKREYRSTYSYDENNMPLMKESIFYEHDHHGRFKNIGVKFSHDDVNTLNSYFKIPTGKWDFVDDENRASMYYRHAKIVSKENKLNFLTPLNFPERTYYESAKSDLKVGKLGQGFENQLIRWESNNKEKFGKCIDILKEMGVINAVSSKRFGGGRFELRVQTHKNGPFTSLSDVGLGVSQLLPVIVADLQLEEPSTLMLSQPETHLHPSLQAKLGQFFINQIKSSSKRYLIETHSEYLFNRMRLAIAKGEILSEDVAMYYFENNGTETIAHKITMTKSGQLEGAPEGFFETYVQDTIDIALNAHT